MQKKALRKHFQRCTLYSLELFGSWGTVWLRTTRVNQTYTYDNMHTVLLVLGLEELVKVLQLRSSSKAVIVTVCDSVSVCACCLCTRVRTGVRARVCVCPRAHARACSCLCERKREGRGAADKSACATCEEKHCSVVVGFLQGSSGAGSKAAEVWQVVCL